MNHYSSGYLPLSLSLLLVLGLAPTAGLAQAPPDYADVAPIFSQHCVLCHRGEGAPLGLRLDSYDAIRRGSANGPVVVAGNPQASALMGRIRGTRQPRMPLTGPPYLSEQDTELIAAWIQGGLTPAAPEKAVATPVPKPLPAPGEKVSYDDVAPILLQRCIKCHMDNGLRGPPPEGLRLQTYTQVIRGGERVVIIPGSPLASELVRRIRGQSRPAMPFDGPPYLSDEEVRVISDWVAQGAADADGRPAPMPVGARVRLQGRLSGYWELDGLALDIESGARIKKRINVGDSVRVRGQVQSNGGIGVSRIQPR